MKRIFFVIALLLTGVFGLQAVPPAWWSATETGIIDSESEENNYAPANLGQLKHVAKMAMAHLDTALPRGAGEDVSYLVESFEPRMDQGYTPEEIEDFIKENYSPINLGQLKAVAKPFYDRLRQAGYDTKANLIARGYPANWTYDYPWDPQTPVSENYSPANLGQLKLVFSFDLKKTAPTVTLVSPRESSSFAAGEFAILAANLSWNAGGVEKVEFYSGATKLGESLASPYQFVWEPLEVGTYTLTAKAIGSAFSPAVSAPVTITVDARTFIHITEPTPGTIIEEDGSVTITAVPVSPEGEIKKVEFFEGANKIGETSTAPYTVEYDDIEAGMHSLTAKLIYTVAQPGMTPSSVDRIAISPPIALVAAGSPEIIITQPDDGTVVSAGSDVTIKAVATVTEGLGVARVEFYDGATKIGEAGEFPFSNQWTNIAAGEHQITAKVIDSHGGIAISPPIAIRANEAPNVNITNPSNEAVVRSGVPLAIEVNATDSDGTIARVEFFDKGSLIRTSTTPPYTHTINSPSLGVHTFIARATDNDGLQSLSSVVEVMVDKAPTVSISAPSAGQKVVAGGDLTVQVTATANEGQIVKIEIFDDQTLLGEALNGRFSWKGVPLGPHQLTAKATSSTGMFAISDVVLVTGVDAPSATLTASTASGEIAPGSPLTLTVNAASNSGTVSQIQLLDGAQIIASSSSVPYIHTIGSIGEGMHSYTARVSDGHGFAYSNTIIINATGGASGGSPHGSPNSNPPPEPGGGGNGIQTDPDPASLTTWYLPYLSVGPSQKMIGQTWTTDYSTAVVTLSQAFYGASEAVIEMKVGNGEWAIYPSPRIEITKRLFIPVKAETRYQFRAYGRRGAYKTPYTSIATYIYDANSRIKARFKLASVDNPGFKEFKKSNPPKYYLRYSEFGQQSYSHSGHGYMTQYEGTSNGSGSKSIRLNAAKWLKTSLSIDGYNNEEDRDDALRRCYDYTGSVDETGSSYFENFSLQTAEESSSHLSGNLDADGFWTLQGQSWSRKRGYIGETHSYQYRDPDFPGFISYIFAIPWSEETVFSSSLTSTSHRSQWSDPVGSGSDGRTLSEEYDSETFFNDVLDALPKYGDWTDLLASSPHSSFGKAIGWITIGGEKNSIKVNAPSYKIAAYPTSSHTLRWYEIFVPANDPENFKIIRERIYTPNGAPTTEDGRVESQPFEIDPKLVPETLESGTYCLVDSSDLSVSDRFGKIDDSLKASGIVIREGESISFEINQLGGGDISYVLMWSGTSFLVIDTRTGQPISSGHTISQKDIQDGVKGTTFRVISTAGTRDGDRIVLSMGSGHGGQTLGSDNFSVIFEADPVTPEDSRDYTFPADYASGSRYRKVALNGRPLADEKPQNVEETDETKEETYVDALTLALRHSTTEVYVPVPGSPLALSARRNTLSESWTIRSGLRPHERPDRPFGIGWMSNLTPSVEFVNTPNHPHYAYVTDENGSVHRFVMKGGAWVPMPTSSVDNTDYLTTFTGWIFTGKYGNKIEFESTSINLQISADREKGSNEVETHSYHRASKVKDRLNNSLVYAYANAKTLIPATISVVGAPGQTLYIRQNDLGLITKIWDPNGNKYEFAYDPLTYTYGSASFKTWKLASVTAPDGGVTRYGYNLAVEPDQTPIEPGDTAVPKYHCDIDRIEDPLGNSYSFGYSFDHSKSTYSAKHGYYIQTGLPRNVSVVTLPGNAGSATFVNRSSVGVTYDSNPSNLDPGLKAGSLCATEVTDVMGNKTTYSFTNGQVFNVNVDSYTAQTSSPKIVYFTNMTIGHPNGGTEVFTFNPSAGMALQSAQDLSGNVATFAYDDTWSAPTSYRDAFAITGFNAHYEDPTSQTNALGHTKVFTYGTPWRIMSSVVDEEGRKTEYTLDGIGRRTAEIIKTSSNLIVQQTNFVYGNTKFPGVVTRKTIHRLTSDPAWAGDLVTTYTLDTAGRIASETVDPGGLNLTTTYTYDLNGNKLSVTDPNGNTSWFDYDSRNRLVWVTYPDDYDKHLEYDLRGNKIRETDENGHITALGYDALNRLTSVTKNNGSGQSIITQNAYNAVGSKTSVTDPNENVVTMEYDTIQRLTKTTTPAGITTYEYGTNSGGSAFDTSAFKPTKATDPRGYITNVAYDALYRPITSSVEYKTGVFATTTSVYDKVGNLTSQTDPLSKITATEFDTLNRPVKVTFADSKFVTTAYTGTGLKWKVTDELGRETETEYDRAGRATKVKGPVITGILRAETQTLYDGNGNIIGLINPLGKQWDYTFDNRNRKVSETGPEVYDAEYDLNVRPISRWAYDAVGSVIGVTDPRGNRTDTAYDAVNRPIQVEAPAVVDPSDNTLKRPTSTTTYDANGNVLSVTDANGHVTSNVYDALNRLTSTTDAASITVGYEYDAAGNRTKVTDGRNHATLFEYDGLNRNTKITNVANQSTVFSYNAVNKISRTDAKGQITSYTYDDRHRLKTVSYNIDSAGNQTYSYDHVGNLLSVVEPGKSGKADVAYTYDVLNRVISETSGGVTHQYEYDLAGNRLKTTYGGSGLEIVSTYDALNRLSTMAENGRSTTYRYDSNGKVVEKELPGDTLTEMTYDALGRVKSIIESINGSDLSQTDQKYDLAGNVLTVEEEYFSGSLSDRTVKNSYDNINRLVEEAVDLGSTGTADITTSYVYDAGNNRTQKTVTGGANAGVTSYTVNTLDQITTLTAPSGTITYTYDANGNRITRTKGTPSDTYGYDGENRLIALEKTIPDPGLTTGTYGYTYDYRTRRVERDESGAGGNTTKVIFSDGLSIYEEEGGTKTVEYVRGSDYGGGVGGILYTLRGGTPSYNHYNNRGDVVAKTNGIGVLTYLAQYEAFGNRLEESGSTPDRQKMNTKEEDPTGLVNHGFRYFDLETEDWLTRDPAGFVDGPNLYAYVRQNPWTSFDPEGLAVEPSLDFLEAAYRGIKNWFTERKQIADDRKQIAQIRQDNPNLAKKADQGIVGQVKRLREMQVEFIEGRVAEIDGLVPSGTSSAQLEKRKAEYEQIRALHDVQRGVNERDQESINQAVAVGSMFLPLPGGKGRMLGNVAAKSAPAIADGKFYSTAFETTLKSTSYPGMSRAAHFQEANGALLRAMEGSPEIAARMQGLGINLERTATGLAPRQAPAGWTWHHAPEPGVMQLVPRSQHAPGSIFQPTLHPGGQGGMAIWGK